MLDRYLAQVRLLVDVAVDFCETMERHNGMVRDAAFLAQRLTSDVVAPGEVMAIRQ